MEIKNYVRNVSASNTVFLTQYLNGSTMRQYISYL
jgi:hypothetical protein